MTNAIAYMRCSGKGQIDGDTWDRQMDAITTYALAHDITIQNWYRDEGVSGKTELEDRPGLAACLERVENNHVKMVLVESADRLARDSMVSELIVREFQKVGGTIMTASGVNLTEGGDNSPTAALIRTVLSAIAEFDRRVTVLKLRAARERKKKREGRCEGVTPFGTSYAEQVTLRIIVTMSESGKNSEEIALHLNAHGHSSRSGKPWRGSVIRKILARENQCNKLDQKAS